MFPVHVGHERHCYWRPEGQKWSSSHSDILSLTCWLFSCHEATNKPLAVLPSPGSFLTSQPWARCTCLATWCKILASAGQPLHQGQNQQESVQLSISPHGLQFMLVILCSPELPYYIVFLSWCCIGHQDSSLTENAYPAPTTEAKSL